MIFKSLSAGLVFVLVFGMLVFAQQMPSGATLRGRFVYEDTGLPLRRAWVGLTLIKSTENARSDFADNTSASDSAYNSNAAGYGEEGELVLTGDNGEFVLKNIRPGIYFPYVKQSGIFNPGKSEAENSNFRPIMVTGEEEIEIDFAVKRGGAIEGRVSYGDGSPALGISISCKRVDKSSKEDDLVVRTDDRGIYRFPGLNNGDYIVFASEPVVHGDRSYSLWDSQIEDNPRKSMLKVYYPGGYSAGEARPVSVQLGQEHPNVDIVIPNHPFATLSGVVISAKATLPLAGYAVSFIRVGEDDDFMRFDPGGHRQVTTDENGRWAFNELLPGMYKVTASRNHRPGILDLQSAVEDGEIAYASLTREIEITEGINDNIVLELTEAATISGTIEYEGKPEEKGPFSLIFVRAADTEQDYYDSAFVRPSETPNSEIKFKLSDLQAGNYELSVSDFSGPYVRAILLNGDDITDAKIDVKDGESIKSVRIILATDHGTVEGRITNSDVPAGRYVYLTPSEFSSRGRAHAIGAIKPNGTFELKAKPGLYYLVTRDFDVDAEPKTQEAYRIAWEDWVKGAEIVELKPRETTKVTITID